MLKIRRYRAEDNEVVRELHHAGIVQMRAMIPETEWREVTLQDEHFIDRDLDDIEGEYINNRGDFLVGIQGREIVVIGALRKATETCGELKRLRVRQDCQQQGHGETMMLKLIERAEELGYRELILDTMASNTAAHRLFEKLGFTELRRERKGPLNLSIFGKKLNKEGK
jgi:putative acetyltransferase